VDRVVIIGTTGSGKSTLAAALAAATGAEHVELDGLYHRPGWTAAPVDGLRARLRAVAAEPRWVADGNYLAHSSLTLWPRAEVIVWLDLPLWVVLPRLIRRSAGRIVRGTRLWHGNRESWSRLLGPESIVRWAISSHARHRRELPAMLAALPSATVVRLTSPRAVDAWLARSAGG
jgi:adenylate kinase family enzyme